MNYENELLVTCPTVEDMSFTVIKKRRLKKRVLGSNKNVRWIMQRVCGYVTLRRNSVAGINVKFLKKNSTRNQTNRKSRLPVRPGFSVG